MVEETAIEEERTDEAAKDWLIPNRVYDVLKWVGLIALPAMATLVGAVSPAWGMDGATTQAVVVTINAVATFVGALIGVSAYKGSKAGDDDEQGD